MPIPGIVASGISGSKIATGAFYSIATLSPSATSTATFSSIPSTYKSLQLRIMGFDAGTNALYLRFNSDTATNYSDHSLFGSGTTVTASGAANDNRIYFSGFLGGTVATYPNVAIIDIIDYASTSKYKTTKSFFGANKNATGSGVELTSGNWRNTAAISTIDVINSATWSAGTNIALYGIL